MKAILDEAGKIELPVVVQSQLRVKPGDEISLEHADGRWFLQSAAEARDEELNWENLDYDAVPMKRAAPMNVVIHFGGKLQPALHDLDEE